MLKNIQILMDTGMDVYVPIYKCKNCGATVIDYNSTLPYKFVDFKKTHNCVSVFGDEFVEFGILEQIGYKVPKENQT